MNKIQMFDQLENALTRATMQGKDKDLVIALKALYLILKEQVKEDEQQKTGD